VSASNGRLAGRVAVVTGGAGGLGRAIAARFVAEGAEVTVTDVDRARGEATAAEIGARFRYQDVTDEAGWADLMANLKSEGHRLDVLVNNAGYAPVDRGLTPEDLDLETTEAIFRVNFNGTLLGCKYAIAAMKSDGGAIVNLSSIAALVPVPFITAYGAAKAAVRHLTTSVALHCAEQGYRIRCNSIHPGQIRTPMHDALVSRIAEREGASRSDVEAMFRAKIPTGAFGREEDVAAAALFFASDESAHVTGDRILVDGGMMLSN